VSYLYRSPTEPLAVPISVHALEVGAGEEVIVAPHLIPQLEPANLSTATAWMRNELIFDSTPLPEVAMEFNRLNARQLVIDGPGLENFHVSGVFPALDPTSLPRLLTFLRAQPGIQVSESGDRVIVTEK
jgi:transmembrane sensor